MAFNFTLDGQDASVYGIYLGGTFNYLGGPPIEVGMFPLAGAVRSVRNRVPGYSARDLSLPVSAALNSLTLAARETGITWLAGFLGKDVVVGLNDGATTVHEIVGTVVDVPFQPVGTLCTPVARGTFRVKCADPSFRRIGTPPLALSTSRIAIPMGTAPIEDWVLEFMSSSGSVTGITATIRDAGGAVVATLRYSGTITTTQHLESDAGVGSVRLESAGAWTNALASWTGGLPKLDDGRGLTIQLSADSGTPRGVLRATIRDW